MTPKVFISYSWTDQAHQERVKEWADRLMADGVDVVLDLYDLKEGQDKNAFMESMVHDKKLTNVLVVSDKGYTEKANKRSKGVGTESQIISQEVYDQVGQTKFIPIVTEFQDDDAPYIPTFLKSRIWIDFSSPQKVNDNWEQLIRLLYNKPLHQKPKLGKAPAYLDEASAPATPAKAKFQTLKHAILSGKTGISVYRAEFLDACISYVDEFRIRERPNVEKMGPLVLDHCTKFAQVRDLFVDWVLLESSALPSAEFSEELIAALERVRDLRSRPAEVHSWNESWYEAPRLFGCEVFLYTIAALLKTQSYTDIHNVYTSHYLLPYHERRGDITFEKFDGFMARSEVLQSVLSPEGKSLLSPAAALFKQQATRSDLTYDDVMQADLLSFLMSMLTPDAYWYPQTMHYASYGSDFPFFLRASQHKHFKRLATVTGISTAKDLRDRFVKSYEERNIRGWGSLSLNVSFLSSLNMDKLDTIK